MGTGRPQERNQKVECAKMSPALPFNDNQLHNAHPVARSYKPILRAENGVVTSYRGLRKVSDRRISRKPHPTR